MRDRNGAAVAIVTLASVSLVQNGVAILRDVSFTVSTGQRIALLGANGAGKTSLLRTIHGLTIASSGRVNAPIAGEQAMLFQKPSLLRRSAAENVAFAMRARGFADEQARARASECLDRCGLSPLSDRYARTLSGGEQQKLALARAMALQPKLLLADEPTASLAPRAVFEVERLIDELCNIGATLVVATHNRGQAKRLATRIVFMSEGRIVEDRPTDDFFSNPVSQEAIDYLNVERI
jgi:tungstate transport system ATP-binding protein